MKQTAVEWLINRLQSEPFLTHEDFQQAKQMERQKNIELITWVKENFTSEAPLDYIINEYKKLEVTNEKRN